MSATEEDDRKHIPRLVPARDLVLALILGGAAVGASRAGLFGNEPPLPLWAALVPAACVLALVAGQIMLGIVLMAVLERKK